MVRAPTDEEYRRFVEQFSAEFAAEFRTARGTPDRERAACLRYFRRGLDAHLSTGELVDFLGVSTPSVLDKAGYSEADRERLLSVVGSLTDDEIAAVGL